MIQALIKKYGGGKNDLNNIKLPISLDLIFNNKYLDYANILCVLYTLRNKKSGIIIDELAYYVTLIYSLSKTQVGYSINYQFIQNTYLDISKTIKKSLIYLANQNYITLITSKNENKVNLKVCIGDAGIKIVADFISEYFKEIILKSQHIYKNIPYNAKNKLIVWRNSWDVH